MKKVLNVLKSKKGITLIELVVGMLTFTITAVSASAVLAPTLSAYAKANALAEINMLLDSITGGMLSDITRAAAVAAYSDGRLTIATNANNITYYVNGATGALHRSDNAIADAPVLEKRYYKGKSVEIIPLDKDENPIAHGNITEPFYIQVNISSDKENSIIASRKYAVNPLGFADYKPSAAEP